MNWVFVLAFGLLSSFAHGTESKSIELPDFSNLSETPTETKVKFGMTCTYPDGRKVSSESPDYQACLQQAVPSSASGQSQREGSFSFTIAD